MEMKIFKKLLSVIMLFGLLSGTSPALAVDGPPAGFEGMTGAPSAEQIAQMQQQAQAQAQAQASGSAGASGASAPETPDMPAGVSEQIAAQVGAALESIREGLISAEEGIQEMKDGQIKIDPAMEKAVTAARPIYNAAYELFQAGDYQGSATKLEELSAVGFDKKYAAFAETQGVSLDLIKDIRAKLNEALKQISEIDEPDEQLSAQADIMTQINFLDEAEKLLKQGKKKEAAGMLKQMRKASGEGAADAAMAAGKGMAATQIGKVLDKIDADLTRADNGMEKAKERGIVISSELQDAMDKTKALYAQAKAAYDSSDYKKAAEILKQMKDSKLKELSMSYRDKILPADRLKEILQEGKNGSKALKLSIEKAKEYGVDTVDLAQLSAQLDALLVKAEEAINAKDTDLFLTIMGEAEALNVRERVDAAIRTVAEGRAKEILGEGLTAVKTAIEQLTAAIRVIAAKSGAVTKARELVVQASSSLAKAQAYYDQADYKSGGRILDDTAKILINTGNILRDSGAKISKEQLGTTDNLIKILNKADGLSNADSNMMSKAQSLLSGLDENNIIESKQTIAQFNPELLDKVLAFRQKDQKLIDGVINEVMPLIPERDRQAMMEDKINLLEESVSANKTIKIMQALKGLNKNTVGDFKNIAAQVKSYNFTAEVADSLDGKISDLNDKIQSGEVKDIKMVDNYVKALKDVVAKDVVASQAEKFKQKLIPAKNVDDNNPLFAEIKYLKDDGAIVADKNGNINTGQIISGKALTDIVNKTQDKSAMKPLAGSKVTVKDAAQKIIESYGVKAQANPANAAQFTDYLNKLGADIKQADLGKPANLGQIAELVAAADQEWGNK